MFKVATLDKKLKDLGSTLTHIIKLLNRPIDEEKSSTKVDSISTKQMMKEYQSLPKTPKDPTKHLLNFKTENPTTPTPSSQPQTHPKKIPHASTVKPTKTPSQTPTIFKVNKQTEANESLEQQIGSRWLIVLGIVTLLFGVGFFLKYVYENSLISPTVRIIIVSASAFGCLFTGEWTRRRDYGIAARGLTALGFALLYTATFSAYGFYHLIDIKTAFGLSILVTISAMIYALKLDEILIAFLALFGGFLSPLILARNIDQPHALFGYLTILSVGAIFCASSRRWRTVNALTLFGSFIHYGIWYDKFYRPELILNNVSTLTPTALGWLTVFFTIFMVLPLTYGLSKKIITRREEVLMLVSNASMTLLMLFLILHEHSRNLLSTSCVMLCLMHIFMALLVHKRCSQDVKLIRTLWLIGLFFMTLAIPLYFEVYAVSMAWAVQAVILLTISYKYKSVNTRVVAWIVMSLSCINIFSHIPLHQNTFKLYINSEFISWIFSAIGLFLFHLLMRKNEQKESLTYNFLMPACYIISLGLLETGILLEWHSHIKLNLDGLNTIEENGLFLKMFIPVISIFIAGLVTRPLCPKNKICPQLAGVLALISSLVICHGYFDYMQREVFTFIINNNFALVMSLVSVIFYAAWKTSGNQFFNEYQQQTPCFFLLLGIVFLWVILTQESYLFWKFQTGQNTRNAWMGQMSVSILWAIYASTLMAIGLLKKVPLLRYLALMLFGLVLFKVFMFDLSHLENIYRIGGFMVLGILLITMSFMYQHARKKGLFSSHMQNTTVV